MFPTASVDRPLLRLNPLLQAAHALGTGLPEALRSSPADRRYGGGFIAPHSVGRPEYSIIAGRSTATSRMRYVSRIRMQEYKYHSSLTPIIWANFRQYHSLSHVQVIVPPLHDQSL